MVGVGSFLIPRRARRLSSYAQAEVITIADEILTMPSPVGGFEQRGNPFGILPSEVPKK